MMKNLKNISPANFFILSFFFMALTFNDSLAGLNSPDSSLSSSITYIGHRGASGSAPENTLESVKLAFDQGAKASEVDVYLTKDDQIVVLHDPTLERTGKVKKKIQDLTWDEVKTIDVGSFKGKKWSSVRVPKLEDLLKPEVIPADGKIFVEIKESNPKIIGLLGPLLKRSPLSPNQINFIGFNLPLMTEVKKVYPQHKVFFLANATPYPEEFTVQTKEDLNHLIKLAKENQIDGLDLEYSNFLTQEIVQYIKAQGLDLAIWSYEKDDTPEKMWEMVKRGIHQITTNYPKELKEKIDEFCQQGNQESLQENLKEKEN